MLEPRDFMVPVVDVIIPEARKKPITDWSNFEALVPRPSVSVSGMYMEMRGTPSAPIIRHVIRREAHERTVTFNEQGRLMGALAEPKQRYVPPVTQQAGSSATNHHLVASGFKQNKKEFKKPQTPQLPAIPQRQGSAGSRPTTASRAAKSAPEASKIMSAMERAAQGISEQHWTSSKKRTGRAQNGQGAGSIASQAGDMSADNWDHYYKQQRATMSSNSTFTWGGRYAYKGLDTAPDERVNFQAGARRRPLQLR